MLRVYSWPNYTVKSFIMFDDESVPQEFLNDGTPYSRKLISFDTEILLQTREEVDAYILALQDIRNKLDGVNARFGYNVTKHNAPNDEYLERYNEKTNTQTV